MEGYIQCAESEKYAVKNSLSSKAVIQNRKRDKELHKQKLKEFMTTKPALQEILGDTLSGEKMKQNKKDKKQQRLEGPENISRNSTSKIGRAHV